MPSAQRVVVVERRGVPATSSREAALVPGIVGAVAGAPIVGVVRRRAEAEELEAVGVVVRVEQVGELRRRSRRRSATRATPNTTRLSRPAASVAAGIGIRSAMPARSASSKSTIQRMPASIASCSPRRSPALVASSGSGACGSGPTASGRVMSLPVTVSRHAVRPSARPRPSGRAAAAPAARAARPHRCPRA